MHDASPPPARHRIGYALFGPARKLQNLNLWRQTWLRGLPFVYVPDEPVGEFGANYRPIHVSGTNRVEGIWKTVADANMLWAVHIANASFPDKEWVFVVDGDAFVFPSTLERYARTYDPRRPLVIAVSNEQEAARPQGAAPLTAAERKERRRSWARPSWWAEQSKTSCRTAPHCPQPRRADGVYPWSPGCCICPVRRAGPRDCCFSATSACPAKLTGRPRPPFVLDWENGTARYSAPRYSVFGGTGVLIAKSLLDRVPSRAFAKCAQQLVCGSADWRLATCLHNLADVQLVRAEDNKRFLASANLSYLATRRAQDVARSRSELYVWGTAENAIFERLAAGGRCPWALHKLVAPDAAARINRTARHCLDVDRGQRARSQRRCHVEESNGGTIEVCDV